VVKGVTASCVVKGVTAVVFISEVTLQLANKCFITVGTEELMVRAVVNR